MMDHNLGHIPVLERHVMELLGVCRRGVAVDCTVGLGGHAKGLLRAWEGEGCLIGMDVDEGNLRLAKAGLEQFSSRVRLFQANFSELETVLQQAELSGADAILADIGVASTHLDDPARGFSFQQDGPLDMRMDLRLERTAEDIVNTLGEKELADLIFEYGQERFSRRIASEIVKVRKTQPLLSTSALAAVITRAIPAVARRSRQGVNPATRTFQALRIAVNDELGCLERLLETIPKVLNPGGRACIISFHSLEDRLVKRGFASWVETGQAKLITRKPLVADEQEIAVNPRSRSAKLRCIERISEM